MGFLGIYRAIYDYAPQSEGELTISEGDLLYVLDKSQDDDWWKAKKKVGGEDEEEPEGLIPTNYVEEAQATGQARALYEYTRQTDEELSFPEDAQLSVYDTSDPDWILVGLDGEFGFVPANYIEVGGDGGQVEVEAEAEEEEPPPAPKPPALPSRSPAEDLPSPPLPPRAPSPGPSSPVGASPAAAALASVLARNSAPAPAPAPAPTQRREITYSPPIPSPNASDDDEPMSPPLPTRPQQAQPSPRLPQRHDSTSTRDSVERPVQFVPGGFHMYNINEMISLMGKRKKMPTTLGINLKTGTILIAPERAQDGPSKEWTAEKMTHYSREGKHVFMELVRPSKSVDFHAGAKDTAEEIVAALGELAGAVRAEGLREVIMAGTGHEQKRGVVLYDFVAQGDDEVTVAIGDEVIVTDDSKSEEWWQVRRLKNGKEGVMPSSYVEITGTVPTSTSSATSGINAGKSIVAQNRLEEERLTKEAVKSAAKEESKRQSERSRRENGRAESASKSSGKSKPDASKVRNWTDRSKSFSVEAQFLGIKDGKLHLHKMNGVKIAVPVVKMSIEDLEYVERLTGISLDEDKPLSSVRKKLPQQQQQQHHESSSKVGASIEPKKSEYDWFQFFLSCEVAPAHCERYSQAFIKDSMDESVLADVEAPVLRTLGLREGDIIKVMRFLDTKFSRAKKKGTGDEEGEGGLFSGPGGTLRNNTRRGRPVPNSQASDVVDAKAFSLQDGASKSPTTATSPDAARTSGGFEDDAWDVKPSKQPTSTSQPRPAEASSGSATSASQPTPAATPLTAAMRDLSLLTQPLQPDKTAAAVTTPAATAPAPAPAAPAQAPQPTGATPSFFTTLAQQQTGMQGPAMTGTQQSFVRQRPLAPQYTQGQPGLMPPPPPPTRPLSAPQSVQPSAFGVPPLQPQMTGVVGQVAPPGQSLNDIAQTRMQQQYAQQMQQQMQGFQPQSMMPMMTGAPQQQPGFGPNQFMSPAMMNGPQSMQSPFADPIRPTQFSTLPLQPTGFPGQQQFGAPPGGINTYLPPALEPQQTGMPQMQPMQPQATGIHFAQGFGNQGMTPGPGPQPPLPLMPQQTGPAPPVRFGVSETSKLMPQPTGRRANLSAATPQNPFGF